MMYLALPIGAFMFLHYGCAVLKHDASASSLFLKLTLILKLICSVLVFRAAWNNNYWDLLVASFSFMTLASLLSPYFWAHGITFVEAGKRIHDIKFKDLMKSIKDTL